ncbi:unnamed protein product [Ceutorhynchus assimilis]|uniref:tRNA-dihydrouridine(16/17) synthase [NAD(P)(+)] n=1 Tax=Ceutorhynchus assimilis TaxID=467358 RepID=A0A9N9QML4_9CUCU|nr:unnamed protein product [Ceutorhynchus assimilis]
MDFWQNTLGAPVKIVAPMVDASELAWRMLSRKYGAQLCYTPMFHSGLFARDPKYRAEALATCPEDTPLIIQFCGNDPEVVLEAALQAQDYFSAIDLNLGCPQAIAKRGRYGAFLQEDWPLLHRMVNLLSTNLKIPVTCKIRRLETIEKTVAYAQMLENAGCKMLTVHGRTRDQKGPLTGLADWSFIKAVKQSVKIPVIANGNIQNLQDLERCLTETGVEGVMTAEGNLYNPAIFLGRNPPSWKMALEYLELTEKFSCPNSYIRGHLFKIFHHVLSLTENNDLRVQLGAANTLEQFKNISNKIKISYEKYHKGLSIWPHSDNYDMTLPPWLCQPYVRNTASASLAVNKRQYEDPEGNPISRKKMKKLRRILRRPEKLDSRPANMEKCCQCQNPLGSKCHYRLCRKCCRDKCFLENLDCEGHRILVRTRREMAKSYALQKLIK